MEGDVRTREIIYSTSYEQCLAVNLSYLLQEPQGWFTGIIEKVGAEVLRVKYPDGWRDHDPNKWSIEKL